MDKKEIFKRLIADSIELGGRTAITREQHIPHDLGKIISLLGPRRSGKTFHLYSLMGKLKSLVPPERLIYLNFEDDRLFPLKLEEMDGLIQGYYELYPENKDETVYFFFDEVQEVENWEKFIRRLDDQENCRLFITGSSSRLLSRELATSLRGRTLPYEVFPLNFREFLTFKKVSYNRESSKGRATLQHEVINYLRQGGFPELIFLPEAIHNRTINEYINLMLYKDITERFSISQPHLMKYLMKFLLINMGRTLSVNKVFQDLKSQGYAIGKNTVYDYISYLEEAFLIFRVNVNSHSIRKQSIHPSKIYGIDSAFKYAMSSVEDRGQILENAIFLELRRNGNFPNFIQGNQEIDFFLEDGRLINVCHDMASPQTRKREVNGLREGMRMMGLIEGHIITMNQYEEIQVPEGTIIVRPVWEFLLGE